jgi:hypothetical protein
MKIKSNCFRFQGGIPKVTFVIGLGYYIDQNSIKNLLIIERSLATLQKEIYENNLQSQVLLIVINDHSEIELNLEDMLFHPTIPYIHIFLDKNQGRAGKENILEYLAFKLGQFYFRFDADVKLITPPLNIMSKYLTEHSDIYILTINAGFMGYIHEKEAKKTGKLFVETAQVGNAIMIDIRHFDTVGFSDPLTGYFHDLDQVYRGYVNGLKSGMLIPVKGYTKSGGVKTDNLDKYGYAKYLESVCPYIKVHIRKKDNMPIIKCNRDIINRLRDYSPRLKSEASTDLVPRECSPSLNKYNFILKRNHYKGGNTAIPFEQPFHKIPPSPMAFQIAKELGIE